MAVILCDLDTGLEMYTVPSKFRYMLENKFQDCKFIYNSDVAKSYNNEVDIYWGNHLPIDFLERYPRVKWIHFGSVGIDRFKLIKNKDKNSVLVTNSNDSVTNGMHSHLLYQIFYLLRQGYLINKIRNNKKLTRKEFDLNFKKIINVEDLRILIVGYGNIGKRLGDTMLRMGAKVTGIATSEKILENKIQIYKLDKLETLAKDHNLIVGLLPYSSNLEKVFNYKIFDNMPFNSYFINNGRPSHVNENDLCNALDKNLSAAALDVFVYFHQGPSNDLHEKENLLITPHVGAVDPSYWSKQRLLFEFNLKCFLNNKLDKMRNICNKVT